MSSTMSPVEEPVERRSSPVEPVGRGRSSCRVEPSRSVEPFVPTAATPAFPKVCDSPGLNTAVAPGAPGLIPRDSPVYPDIHLV